MGFDLIGIVGPIACGKGVVVDYLKKKYKYTSFSLSSLVHEEAKKRAITITTRTILQDIGDELRKNEGDDVLAKRAVKRIAKHKVIIEGIRNPGEILYLRSLPSFYLIALDAPAKVRFSRLIKRAKPWDPKDWEAFMLIDGRDEGDLIHSNGQQVKKCMAMADVLIKNDMSIEEVEQKIDRLFLK